MRSCFQMLKNTTFFWILLAPLGCVEAVKPPSMQRAEIVKQYPHDESAFTQGLVFHDGVLYEGTGQKGHSKLRKVDLETGRDLVEPVSLDPNYFGEGITILQDKIYQLTWRDNYCLVYDVATMSPASHFVYEYEGWGLTNNGEELIVSDGTHTLRFVDPETFKLKRKIEVVDRGKRIKSLNELEWVEGEIWANIWYEDRIARISPETGIVTGWIDLRHIYPQSKRPKESVMNGIAYDEQTKRIFITGKNWSQLYEIKVKD